MKTALFAITIVEDRPEEVEDIITILKTTKYFRIDTVSSYRHVMEDRIQQSDLFILDVWTRESDRDFCEFIPRLRMAEKPFIAFTRLHDRSQSTELPGRPKLRQLVFESGGLCMLSKLPDPGDLSRVSRQDLQMDLVERVMQHYWSTRHRAS